MRLADHLQVWMLGKKFMNTGRNLYQLNANEVPLTLHYGFEGRIIILHKNPYRSRLQNEAETVGNIVIYYLKMTLMLIEKVL